MDFIIDNIYLLVLAAAGLAQWWKATQDAKKERENPQPPEDFDPEGFDPGELEEFIEEAERRQARAAVPPPVPSVPPPLPSGERGPMPGVERSPVPALKRKNAEPRSQTFTNAPGLDDELARQAALAEQLRGLKHARIARPARIARLARGAEDSEKPVFAGGSLRSRLGSRRELRQAFVLKEILEKPVGLR